MPSITNRRSTHVAERRAAFEARILDAVERLLAGGANFTDLSVQHIVEEAGVARSTFYMHFRDKTELVLRLVENLATTAFGTATSWDPNGNDPAGALVDVMAEVIGFYRERAHLLRAVLEVAAYDESVRELWNGQLEEFVAQGRQWLKAAQTAGEAPADLRADTNIRIMVWGGVQAIAHHIATGDPADDIAVAHEIAMVQWFGGFRRPAGPKQ